MKQKRIIKNNRQRAIFGIDDALFAALLSIAGTAISAGVSTANTEKQIAAQKEATKKAQEAQNRINNEQNALQQQANLQENLNDSNNLELETTKTGNIQTLNSQDQTFSAKMGGKRKFCKYGNNALSNIKNIGKFI